uniref:DUF4238 domain-containing protein n=1 Tax=Caulobacter sp. (strain K31) TaxID=366602 RepID=B0T6I5_CAUSK
MHAQIANRAEGATPKRHHFVPRMLQKRFVDRSGWLHAYTRSQPWRGVYRSRPENLFVQGHLYSEITAEGRRRPVMERRLGALEDIGDRVLAKVIAAARSGAPPSLATWEMDVWYLFMTLQWKRVPDLHHDVTTKADALEIFAEVLANARAALPHLSSELDLMQEPQMRDRLIHNSRVGSLGVSPEVMDALRSRGLAVLRINHPAKQFILASRPVLKLTSPGKTNLRHPECEVWLPVAPDIALGLGRGQGLVSLYAVSPQDVRYLNLASAGQSTTICSASPDLVRSLSRPR